MNEVFQALSDQTRRAMLRELSLGERTVGQLAEAHPMTLPAASKHIRVLERAGLIRREIRWRTHVCHLEAAPLERAYQELQFYAQFWTSRLDVLERLLHEEDAQAAVRPSNPDLSDGEKA
jgi:DNA-binding transcriptional ArsR family regulator